MAKRLLKTMILPLTVLATALAFIACDGGDTPSAAKYKVTYAIGADATGTAPTETDKAAGEKFLLKSADGITHEGNKSFTGWSDGSITYQAGDEYTMPSKAVTFTAQWETPPATYSVTYDLNGGGGTTPAQSYKGASETFNIATTDGITPPANKEFRVWSDGTNEYAAGAEYTMSGQEVVFTAQWKDKGQNTPEKETIYSAFELDSKGTILLYDDGTGMLDYYSEAADKNVEVSLTYTLSGSSIAITIGGGTYNGTYNGSLLTVQITYLSNVYKFGPAQQQPSGVPTFTFQLNGGTGSVPTLTVTEEMKKGNYYMVPMPANTITPPDGKAFRRWTISDGTGEWNTNAGSKFSADEGVAYTVKPEWKDGSTTVVPTGTKYTGDWNTPAGTGSLSVIDSVNITNVWLDKANNKLYYVVGSTAKVAAFTVNNEALTDAMKTAYGDDAALYSVTIETLAYNFVVKADNSKLAFAGVNSDMTLYADGEFTVAATYTVTYNKPEDATGDAMAVVTAQEGDYTLAACTYTKEGWTFLGWLNENPGRYDDPVAIAAGEKIDLSSNMSYIAVFAKTYTNSQDANISVDLRDDGYVLVNLDDESFYAYWDIISESVYIVTDNWTYTVYYKINGSSYTEGDEMLGYSFTTKDGNTTLTFDGNGKAMLGQHEGTYEKIIETQGWYDILVGVKLTFDGKDYECYFDFDDNDESFTPYIYANIKAGGVDYVFDPYTAWYTITFEVGEGVEDAPESPVQIHTAIGGNAQAQVEFPSEPSKGDYYFVGWAVKSSDGTVGNTVSTYKYKVTQDTTFVAVWVKSTFTITYLPGDVGSDDVTGFEETSRASVNPYTCTAKIAKLRTDVTRTGYVLSHWVIQGDDSGTTYAPGQANVTVTDDTTFVAVWELATPHTVTYNLGGGTGTLPTETNKVKGEKFTLAAATGLTNGDKVFDGWSDGTDKYEAEAEYTMPDKDVTLTAQWKDSSSGGDTELTGTKTYIGTPVQNNSRITSIVIDFDNNQITISYNNSFGNAQEPMVSTLDKRSAGYYVAGSDNPTGSVMWVVISEDGTTITLYDNAGSAPDEQLGGVLTIQQ